MEEKKRLGSEDGLEEKKVRMMRGVGIVVWEENPDRGNQANII